jgi:anti-sigma factor RsiW
VRTATCDTARSRVSLRLDGELSRFETALLQRHLGRCEACAAFAEDVAASTRLLRGARLERPPQFWLTRRTAATRLAVRVAAVTAAAAAAALVAVSSVSLQHRADARASAGFGLWPTGLAIHPYGDGNLGVRHAAYSPDGPRRGLLGT